MKKSVGLIGILLSFSLLITACDSKVYENLNVDTPDEIMTEKQTEPENVEETFEWPEESMGSLPKPKAKVVLILELEGDSVYVELNFDEKNGGKDYLEKIISLGYKEFISGDGDDFVTYTGIKEDNSEVIFMYRLDEPTATLTYTENSEAVKTLLESEENEEESNDEETFELDPASAEDWPENLMDNIPEINAQITDVASRNDHVSIEFENINKNDILAYIEEVKAVGFTRNTMDFTTDDVMISYHASNDKDYRLSINWSENEGYMDYTK